MNNFKNLRNSNYPALIAIAILSLSMLTVSCNKDKDDTTPTTPTVPTPPPAPESPSIEFTDGNGTLSAVITRTFQKVPLFGFVPVDFGVAVAVFYDDPTSGVFLDAGTVMCEGFELTKQTNNSYVYVPSKTNTVGIDYSIGTVSWDVTGAGTVPPNNFTNYNYFPEVGKISSETTINKSKDYVLSSTSVSNSDSVIFMIGGIYHTAAGATSSYTFTASELSKLNAGINYVQVTAYNVYSDASSGKTYYYVNETVVTEQVTLQ
ncbi:MAG TPA: hypothetical protein DCX54_07475 [Flavobacteriales bacterium]|nr:hypothetical protein [Flavobacteriales bacterium]